MRFGRLLAAWSAETAVLPGTGRVPLEYGPPALVAKLPVLG
jgi:hypothetical protein